MTIEVRFKPGDLVYHYVDGILWSAEVVNISRIYAYDTDNKQVIYRLKDSHGSFAKDEKDLYSSRQEALNKNHDS